MEYMENLTEYVEKQASLCQQHDGIDKELYAKYGVKRGLRDENGQGVLTGLTNISQIIAFKDVDGQMARASATYLRRQPIFCSSESFLQSSSSQSSAASFQNL